MTNLERSEALHALQEQRQQYRARLELDRAALGRAEQNVASWTTAEAAAVDAAAAYDVQQCDRMAAAIASDEPAAPVERDTTTALQVAHARLNLAVATRAHASLQAAHQATAAQLAVVDAAIAAEADRVLTQRREALAEDVHAAHAALLGAVAALRAMTPDGLHTPINVPTVPVSARVAAALALLPQVTDDVHTPLHQLRGQYSSPAQWLAQRAALIEGPGCMQ